MAIGNPHHWSVQLTCFRQVPERQNISIIVSLEIEICVGGVRDPSQAHIRMWCLKCYNVDLLLQKFSVTGNQKQYGMVYTNSALKRSICSCFRFLENCFFISVMLFTSY